MKKIFESSPKFYANIPSLFVPSLPCQDSLSQDSKTLMIVCASPVMSNVDETYCSLNFASRVRTVELGAAKKNISSGPAAAGAKSTAGGGAATAGGVKKVTSGTSLAR